MPVPETDYFTAFWNAVARILDCKPRSKTAAIRFGGPEPAAIDGAPLVAALMAAMHGDLWSNPASVGGNWRWRPTISKYHPKPGEVALERRIVERGGLKAWTYQMSTASGLHRPHSGTRQAIDLVCRKAADHYVFIELKVDSDYPFYAAFEVLGYGLAYLQARLHGLRGVGANDVMSARRIDLVVLAPTIWFGHVRGNGRWLAYDFSGLIGSINKGLRAVLSTMPGRLPQQMQLRFESFRDPAGSDIAPFKDPAHIEAAAMEIVDKF